MATKKATTTEDLSADSPSDAQQANADQLAAVEELTDPEVLAEHDEPKTHKVKDPFGGVVEVPESILQALLDSGYSKSK